MWDYHCFGFGKKVSVIGFDISAGKIEMLKQGIDPGKEMPKEAFSDTEILFTDCRKPEAEANFFCGSSNSG
jgi:UDP-N-acetyl-D-galactosamine dehydrogenase